MTYSLQVFCESAERISAAEIADFIREGAYFASAPRFQTEAQRNGTPSAPAERLTIWYAPENPPIIFELADDPALVREIIDDALESLRGEPPVSEVDVARGRLQRAQRIVTIRVNRQRMTEEAWFMLDSVEGFLARRCQGVVFAPEDGIYDAELHPLWKARR